MSRLVERMQYYVFPPPSGPGTFATLGLGPPPPDSGPGSDDMITFTAVQSGSAGNLISVELIQAGDNTPLSIAVAGTAITANLATDGSGNIVTLDTQLAAAFNANPAVAALVTTTSQTPPLNMIPAPQTFLTGGSGGSGTTSFYNELVLQLDQDAPFRLFAVAVWSLNTVNYEGFDGQIALRFKRPDGRLIQKNLTSSNLLFPGNQYNLNGLSPNKCFCAPIYPSVLYPANSTIQVDVDNLPNAGQGVIIVFIGTKVFNEGATWAPGYPPKWKGLGYLENTTIQQFDPTQGPLLNIPFTTQRDADFVWQAGVYTDFPYGSSGQTNLCQLVDLGVILRDWTQKAYSNGYVPIGLLFPFLNAQMPGFLYPEIYIPVNGQMFFDLNYLYPGFTPVGSPITVVLGMKGMKVYPQR